MDELQPQSCHDETETLNFSIDKILKNDTKSGKNIFLLRAWFINKCIIFIFIYEKLLYEYGRSRGRADGSLYFECISLSYIFYRLNQSIN
jgi:hypothetical protein